MTQASDADARLAEGLLRAHPRVAVLEVDDAPRARVLQRLLAISDAAKHDTARAAARLERFLSELDDGRDSGGGAATSGP